MSIGTAVVGSGSFARAIHLPNLIKSPAYSLKAVMDLNAEAAEETAEEFGAGYATSDYSRILSDPEISLIIICTPHNTHAHLSMEAVQAGKHVLVEKPMALRIEDVRPLVQAVRNAGVVLSVGFNRRYAPLIVRAKDLMHEQTGPVMINYRMVDQIWRHPWALDPEIGGGRILSESVHIFDVCTFLVGCEPVRIYAEGGALTHPEMPDTQDNSVMTMRYEDSSIVSITHGDLGNAAYPKERAEIFIGEKTIVLDNYERLDGIGFAEPVEIKLPAVEKGFSEELDELAKAIHGDPSGNLVTEVDGARATLCAVKAIEAINTGMAQPLDLSSVLIPPPLEGGGWGRGNSGSRQGPPP